MAGKQQDTEFQRLLKQGLAALRGGELGAARQHFTQLRARFPGSPEGPHLLGLVALRSGQFEQAARWLAQAARGKARDPDVHLQLGLALARSGADRRALDSLRRVLELRPGDAEALGLFVDVAGRAGRLGDEQQTLRGYARTVEDDRVLLKCAVALVELGEQQAALDMLAHAVERQPDSFRARFNHGTQLFNTGDTERAVDELRAAYRLNPHWPESAATLFRALLSRSPDEAAAFARDHSEQHPGDPQGPLLLSRAERARGDIVAARAVIAAAFERFPRELPVLGEYLQVALDLGEPEMAQRAVTAADQAGHAVAALGLEARRLKMLGRDAETYETVKRGLEQGLDPAICTTLADAARTPERVEEALAIVERQLREAPPRPRLASSLRFARGQLRDRRGEHEAGFRDVLEANRIKLEWMKVERTLAEDRSTDDLEAVAVSQLALAPLGAGGAPRPVFVVGLPRSGTTLTETILGAHPAIAMAGERGLGPACGDLGLPAYRQGRGPLPGPEVTASVAERYRRQLAAYRRNDEPMVTDKSPHNFQLLGVVRRLFPDAVLIHCRRNALDCAVSNLFANFQTGDSYAFSRGLAYAHDMTAFAHFYRRYRALMARWREAGIPIYESDYEALVADPEREIPALLDHVGVDFDRACLLEETPDRPVTTASAFQVRQRISPRSVGRWRRYAALLGPLVEALGDDLDETTRAAFERERAA